jgi:hypothetical protein
MDLAKLSDAAVKVLIAVFAGIWTLHVYTAETKAKQLAAVSSMSEQVSTIYLYCSARDENVVSAARNNSATSQAKECFKQYTILRSKFSIAATVIKKPLLVREADWNAGWKNLDGAITTAGIGSFDADAISKTWQRVVLLSGYAYPNSAE